MSSFLTAVHLIYHASKGNVILLGVQPKHGSIMINPSGSCCYADESREPFILKNAEILFVITHYSLESTNDFLHSHRCVECHSFTDVDHVTLTRVLSIPITGLARQMVVGKGLIHAHPLQPWAEGTILIRPLRILRHHRSLSPSQAAPHPPGQSHVFCLLSTSTNLSRPANQQ